MGKKLSQQDFINRTAQLYNTEYEVLGTYMGCDQKIEIKHIICNHIFFTRPADFLRGHGCPYCGGTKKKDHQTFVSEVENLVKNEYVVLSQYETNHKKIRFKHLVCGNEFEMSPNSFLKGRRCPYCAGKYNGFFQTAVGNKSKQIKKVRATFEQIEGFQMVGEYINFHTPVRIKHVKCNREFMKSPFWFFKNTGCPLCIQDIKKQQKTNKISSKTKTPEQFKSEVYQLVGDEYQFLEEYKRSDVKILVKHNICGFVYSVDPHDFLRGHRCPRCAGNLPKTPEQFRAEVYNLVGEEYQVLDDYQAGSKKVRFLHQKCGNIFSSKPNTFLHGRRCPYCYHSTGEEAIQNLLQKYNICFEREKKFPDCVDIGPLRFDFYLSQYNVCIEFDGKQHFMAIKGFGGELGLQKRQKKDRIKNDYCNKNKIPLLRIKYDENIEEKLLFFLKEIGAIEEKG